MQTHATNPRSVGEIEGFFQRLSFALGPFAAGIILDVLDFATFGPIGLAVGALVGGLAGWILGKYERMDRNLRIAFALGAAAYMTIPFTEPIPAATILILLARYFVGPRVGGTVGGDSKDQGGNSKDHDQSDGTVPGSD